MKQHLLQTPNHNTTYQGHSFVQWQCRSVGSGTWLHSPCVSAECASSWCRSVWNERGRCSTHTASHLYQRGGCLVSEGLFSNWRLFPKTRSCYYLTRMCPHMSFQLVSVSAGIAAETTLEGPLPSMRADVPFQLAHLGKHERKFKNNVLCSKEVNQMLNRFNIRWLTSTLQ